MVARTPGGREVASSILVAPTIEVIYEICFCYGSDFSDLAWHYLAGDGLLRDWHSLALGRHWPNSCLVHDWI